MKRKSLLYGNSTMGKLNLRKKNERKNERKNEKELKP